jgi:carboxypeptidase family protein/TonB-dependent receptor-like protein
MRHLILILMTVWLMSGFGGDLFAQGVQTGTIRGIVNDQQELAIPGVTVTVTSPALQGPRSTVSDLEGLYVIRALPPGDYELRFELPGFATVTRTTVVPLGLTVVHDVTMRTAGVAETVQVTGELPAPITTPVVGANYKQEEIESLATPRSIQGIAQLAPAVSENSPNSNQLVINGAFAFDNVFMINGVDVNDNLFAQPQNLFIEDAIEETQILTSGISAEYGRFTGGVINAITKSGGNTFSGSGRMNLSDPSWTSVTPFEECADPSIVVCTSPTEHAEGVSRTYEGTFGGPIVRDRLWFFAAGRHASVNSSTTLQQTGVVLPTTDENKRGEIKLTGTVVNNHTVSGAYLNDPRKRTNNSGAQSLLVDPASAVDRENPNWYMYYNYRGVLNSNMLAELQYSERRFQFKGDGGTGSDITANSPFVGTCYCTFYNAPYFDATDPEDRDNRQFTGNITNFWNRGGRHETKYGYEFFRSHRTGGNSQSPTSYVFAVDYLTDAAGSPVIDPSGRLIPVFVPGESSLYYYPALKGAVMDTDNHSLFVQDHWIINDRWSADLGARFEQVTAVSTGDITSVDAPRIVPRLAVAYDVKGDGNHIWHVTYGQYAGRYNESQIGANSPVGNPAEIQSVYRGPAGTGIGFAPGTNIANYPVTPDNAAVADPLQNIFMEEGLKSPLVHEFSTSYGVSTLDGRGYVEGSYVFRNTNSLIEDFQDLTTGTTTVVVQGVEAGEFTNIVYRNTDLAWRRYQGLVFQARYRLGNNFVVNGHYTIQLENNGNYEGEETNDPGDISVIGNFPEIYTADRYYPDGRLQNFQRNRFRLWGVYNWGMGAAGNASVSGLWRVEGARAYSLAVRNLGITDTQADILAAAGYPDVPGDAHTFWVPERGTERFPGYGLLDVSVNYDVPVFRTLRPWIKFDIYNILDNRKLIAWNTTISPDDTTPVDKLGLPIGYTEGSSFGRANGNTVTNLNTSGINSFPVAFNQGEPGAVRGGRTFRMSMGVRF